MPQIVMPRLSDTMEEGTLLRWLKHPGDQVRRGDVLGEIETDKTTMELEAYDEGVLEKVMIKEGQTVPIGEVIAIISSGNGDAKATSMPTAATAKPAQPGASHAATAKPAKPGASHAATAKPAQPGANTVRTSPLARAMAARHGIAIDAIAGTGPGGRVVRRDVDNAIAMQERQKSAVEKRSSGLSAAEQGQLVEPARTSAPAPVSAPVSEEIPDVEEVPLSTLRRVTAQRLAKSLEAPHFYLTSVIDAEPLVAFRTEINGSTHSNGPKVSLTDLLVKACANLLRLHPGVNSSWGGSKLLRYRRINIGVAVAVPDGLVVPVIHDADRKSLSEISAQAHELAAKARAAQLSIDDITGGTFTISNLGMYGIDHFTAVINPPQAAILAVGAVTAEAVVRDGQVVAGSTIKATLSVDHRVLDGATGAAFLADLREMLEHPMRILL